MGVVRKKVARVLAMDPVRRVWTVRRSFTEVPDACRYAAELRSKGLRVRVVPAEKKVLTVKPLVLSETRDHRHRVSGQMSDLADARKRYKSMG